jgi:hypothetical protein
MDRPKAEIENSLPLQGMDPPCGSQQPAPLHTQRSWRVKILPTRKNSSDCCNDIAGEIQVNGCLDQQPMFSN